MDQFFYHWIIRTRLYLHEQGLDIWKYVANGYIAPKIIQKIASKKDLRKNNAMEMDIILHGLYDHAKDNVGKCTLAKELRDKLQNLYTKRSLHQEHEDNQNERSNTKTKEHPESDDEISESNASEDKDDSKIEAVVDIEAELISALDELTKEINKNKMLIEQLKKY